MNMKSIRKNASLKSVSLHTRKRARVYYTSYRRYAELLREEPMSSWRDEWRSHENHYFSLFREMREIAEHLARLSGEELAETWYSDGINSQQARRAS